MEFENNRDSKHNAIRVFPRNELEQIHFPTSEGVSEVSGASERANGRASGPVLQSVFLAVFDHSAGD